MQEAFDRRWNKLAQEVLSGMRDWRVQHPTATFTEIEEELDTRMARMRAGLLEDLAMASAAADVGGSQAHERPRCPTCGALLLTSPLQDRTTGGTTRPLVSLTATHISCGTGHRQIFQQARSHASHAGI